MTDHVDGVSYDTVSDFLQHGRSTAHGLWSMVEPLLKDSEDSYLIIDDSVQNKQYSRQIGLVKNQYSGAEGGLVRGIGVVNLVHSDGEEFYPIDYRIYAVQVDGKTKNDHFAELVVTAKLTHQLRAQTILFDSWYASVDNLKLCVFLGLTFITTLKDNRLVSLSKTNGYVHLQDLVWTAEYLEQGVVVKLKEVPFKVLLFKLVATNGDIDWVITNAPEGTFWAQAIRDENDVRWQIEQLHRELKQLTGTEKCQCRKARSQSNTLGFGYLA